MFFSINPVSFPHKTKGGKGIDLKGPLSIVEMTGSGFETFGFNTNGGKVESVFDLLRWKVSYAHLILRYTL